MNVKYIHSLIEERKNELFNLLVSLIKINSENFSSYGNEKEIANYIEKYCLDLGFETDKFSPLDIPGFENHPDYFPGRHLENRYSVVAKFKGKSDKNALILMAHNDTVEIGDRKNWTVDPLGGIIKDGRIYGRGACDDKYAIAVSLFVMKILKEQDFVPSANILFSAYSDEEYGGSHGALSTVLKYPCEHIISMDGTEGEIWNCASGGQEAEYHFHSLHPVGSSELCAKAVPVIMDCIKEFGKRRYEELENNIFYKGTDIPENSLRFLDVSIGKGGTNIASAVVDEFGNIYGRATRKTATPRPYNEIFDDMALCAKEAALNSGIKWENIESVGIGCPGAINKETGYVDFSNNLDFYDVPITQYMENALGKMVYVENDANAAAWGEFVAGSGKDTDSMILLTLGTGVGSGIILNGHLFRGAFGTGAELGHAVIISGGEKCTCGRCGCLETYASATALSNQAKIKAMENPDCEIMKQCRGDVDKINGKTVFSATDDVSKNVIDTYLGYLSEGIVNIVNMFQPEVIYLGGGVSGAGEIILEPIQNAIKEKAFARFGKKHTQMKIASLGNDAGIIGAALLWKDI